MRSLNNMLLVMSLPLLFHFVFAETDMSVNLSQLIEEAKQNNPQILAAREKYEAARHRISGLRNIMDPWLGVEFDGDMRMYSISQELPFPTKIHTQSKFAGAEAEQAFEEYQQVVIGAVTELKKSYAQLFSIEKEIEVMQKSKELLDQMHRIALRNYALNKVTQVDVLRLQIELTKVDNELISLNAEKSLMSNEINLMLNRPGDSLIGTVGDIKIKPNSLTIEELCEISREHRPDLKSFFTAIEKAKLSKSLARQEYLPDLMVKFEQKEMNGQFMGQKYMFGLTLPLWFWAKQNNMVKEMEAEIKMAEADYQAMVNMALQQTRKAKVMLDKASREMNLYTNSILPQTKAAFQSSLRAYEVGQVDFMTLLDNEKMLIESDLGYYQTQADYFSAFAELEQAVGTDLVNQQGE